jgi:hypothetical protein
MSKLDLLSICAKFAEASDASAPAAVQPTVVSAPSPVSMY